MSGGSSVPPFGAKVTFRLAIHFFNTEDEIAAAMEGVAALC